MRKSDLKSGMYGILRNYRHYNVHANDYSAMFVVTGDTLIYEDGSRDLLSDLTDDLFLDYDSGFGVDELYYASRFLDITKGSAELIWKREVDSEETKGTEETEETEETKKANESKDTITITSEQFFKVVEKANERWLDTWKSVDCGYSEVDGFVESLAMLQNVTFATLIAAELFGENA